MAPRRRRTRRSNNRRASTINCNFFGWYDTSTGYIKNIRADAIGMSTSRPILLKTVTMSFTTVASTATYMVPSNAPAVTLVLADGNGSTVAVSSTVLIPFGMTKSITVRTPRQTLMTVYSGSTTVISVHVSQPAPNTTLSYTGVARMRPSRNLMPYGVKIEDTLARLDERFRLMSVDVQLVSNEARDLAVEEADSSADEFVALDTSAVGCCRCTAENHSQL